MKLKYKFIHFVEIIDGQDNTLYWSCRNNNSKEELGQVKWYASWKQFCYFPIVEAVYSVSCFEDINDFIRQIPVYHVIANPPQPPKSQRKGGVMSAEEKEIPRDNTKKYTETDMLAAFQHGREYEPPNIEGDIATESLPEKNRPFWEWLACRVRKEE